MTSPDHAPLNTIEVSGQALLLTKTATGSKIHLTAVAGDSADRQPPIHPTRLDPHGPVFSPEITNYDRDELLDAKWSTVTMCGATWSTMVSGEGGRVHPWNDPAFAPTCGRCLRVMDKSFDTPSPAEGIETLAELAAEAVGLHGSAEIYGTPGDQLPALRSAVRKAVRRRLGHPAQTMTGGDLLLVTCKAATKDVLAAKDAQAARVIGAIISNAGSEPVPPGDGEWRFRWSTWCG